MVHISQDVIINNQLQRQIPGIGKQVDSSKIFFKKYSDVERYDNFMWLDQIQIQIFLLPLYKKAIKEGKTK